MDRLPEAVHRSLADAPPSLQGTLPERVQRVLAEAPASLGVVAAQDALTFSLRTDGPPGRQLGCWNEARVVGLLFVVTLVLAGGFAVATVLESWAWVLTFLVGLVALFGAMFYFGRPRSLPVRITRYGLSIGAWEAQFVDVQSARVERVRMGREHTTVPVLEILRATDTFAWTLLGSEEEIAWLVTTLQALTALATPEPSDAVPPELQNLARRSAEREGA